MARNNKIVFITAGVSVLFIVLALWYSESKKTEEITPSNSAVPEQSSLEAVRDIQQDDHILGNPSAPIVFFVYSDFACPYCKEYYATMKALINFFGREGQVAWVFRHLPFVQLHPEAPQYAHASKCVASEGSNQLFWKFADLLFEKADPLEPLSALELVDLAEEVGISRQSFVACMRSNKFMAEIEADFNEALSAGGKVTPFTIVQAQGKRSFYLGAQPYRVVAVTLQQALRKLDIKELQAPGALGVDEAFSKEMDELVYKRQNLATSTRQATTTQTEAPSLEPLFHN